MVYMTLPNILGVYLCGGIAGLTDAQCNDWRSFVKENLNRQKYYCLDPMRRDYRGREVECAKEIVEEDKKDIDNSAIVLVNACRPSWGTAMEIMYTFDKSQYTFGRSRINIISVCDAENPSPWLIYHSDKIFKTLEEAIKYINELL
jgi:hypothetical protein